MVLSRKKSFKIKTLQILDEKGNLLQKPPPALTDDKLKRLYVRNLITVNLKVVLINIKGNKFRHLTSTLIRKKEGILITERQPVW